jgi:hypothetical protein
MKKLLFLLTLLFSCNSNPFIKNLTNNGQNCFWIEKKIDKNSHYEYFNSQLQFYPDGTFMQYLSTDENKKGDQAIHNIEGSSEGAWEFHENDSTFSINSHDVYKVIKYSKDTVLIEGKNFKGSFALIRHDVN